MIKGNVISNLMRILLIVIGIALLKDYKPLDLDDIFGLALITIGLGLNE